jgi:predicted site-specific integrase-resolvase
MPITIRSKEYYWTAEACQIAGISKNTFFRWLRSRDLEDVSTADRHGWRLFSESDIERLCQKANHISTREQTGVS